MVEPVEPNPHFHALAVFACKSNRFYRVYVRSDELVFIWAGSGTEGMLGAQALGIHSTWNTRCAIIILISFEWS